MASAPRIRPIDSQGFSPGPSARNSYQAFFRMNEAHCCLCVVRTQCHNFSSSGRQQSLYLPPLPHQHSPSGSSLRWFSPLVASVPGQNPLHCSIGQICQIESGGIGLSHLPIPLWIISPVVILNNCCVFCHAICFAK